MCKWDKSGRLKDISGSEGRMRQFFSAAENRLNPLTHNWGKSFWLPLKHLAARKFGIKPSNHSVLNITKHTIFPLSFFTPQGRPDLLSTYFLRNIPSSGRRSNRWVGLTTRMLFFLSDLLGFESHQTFAACSRGGDSSPPLVLLQSRSSENLTKITCTKRTRTYREGAIVQKYSEPKNKLLLLLFWHKTLIVCLKLTISTLHSLLYAINCHCPTTNTSPSLENCIQVF